MGRHLEPIRKDRLVGLLEQPVAVAVQLRRRASAAADRLERRRCIVD